MAKGAAATPEKPRRFEEAQKVVGQLAESLEERQKETIAPWQFEEDKPVEFMPAPLAREIGEGLIDRVFSHLRLSSIDYLFRRKDDKFGLNGWTKKSKVVHGQMKRPTGLLKKYSQADFIVLLNWHSWQAFNPMQRVALVFHELRHGDEEGKIRPHDFEGFFDELEIFGTRTYQDWNQLANTVSGAQEVAHQYSLSLLDEPEE